VIALTEVSTNTSRASDQSAVCTHRAERANAPHSAQHTAHTADREGDPGDHGYGCPQPKQASVPERRAEETREAATIPVVERLESFGSRRLERRRSSGYECGTHESRDKGSTHTPRARGCG